MLVRENKKKVRVDISMAVLGLKKVECNKSLENIMRDC